mgnify:CR=1 FL=1
MGSGRAGRGLHPPRRLPGGVLRHRRDFFFEKAQELEPAAFLEAFLPQFYDANPFLPSEVHLPVVIADPSEFVPVSLETLRHEIEER